MADQQFQVYSPASNERVELHFANWADVTTAFAADAAGMSMAAIETAVGVELLTSLPKSSAWLLVRAYYGGFFAAHAVSRMLGRSQIMLAEEALRGTKEVIEAFGMQGVGTLSRGLYRCTANATRGSIVLERLPKVGSHQAFWGDFALLLREAADLILSAPGATVTAVSAAARFTEVEHSLRDGGNAPNGDWLTSTRNRINYQQADGAWYPYRGRVAYYDGLMGHFEKWYTPSDNISLWPVGSRNLQRFVETCGFLIALCRDVCVDMAARCPKGRSFQRDAPLQLLSHLGL